MQVVRGYANSSVAVRVVMCWILEAPESPFSFQWLPR